MNEATPWGETLIEESKKAKVPLKLLNQLSFAKKKAESQLMFKVKNQAAGKGIKDKSNS